MPNNQKRNCEFSSNLVDDKLFLSVSGELDFTEAGNFRDFIVSTVEKNSFKKLILDFSKLKFIDSSGLGVLIHLSNKAKKEQATKLYILQPNEYIMDILKLTKLFKFFTIVNSKEELDD